MPNRMNPKINFNNQYAVSWRTDEGHMYKLTFESDDTSMTEGEIHVILTERKKGIEEYLLNRKLQSQGGS